MLTLSLAIIAWAILGARSKQEVNQFGFALWFEHPERVAWCLIAVWLWSVIRYLQFGYELLSELKTDLLEDIDAEEMRLVLKTAMRRARADAKAGKLVERGSSNVRVVSIRQEPYFYPSSPAYRLYSDQGDGGRVYEHLGITVEWIDDKLKQERRTNTNYAVELSKRQKKMIAIRAHVNGFLKLPGAGDHVVPLVVAAIALAFAVMLLIRPAVAAAA